MRLFAIYYPFLLTKALKETNKALSIKISPQRYNVMVAILTLHKRKEAITVKQIRHLLYHSGIYVHHAWLTPRVKELADKGYLLCAAGIRGRFVTKIYTVEPAMILFLNTLEKKLRLARVWKEKESNWHKRKTAAI